MPRVGRYDEDDDYVSSPFDRFDDDTDDNSDEDIAEDDVDDEARAFYQEHAAPMTPEDTVAILAAAAGHPAPDEMVCAGCGCTDTNACPGGCFWMAPNVCSRCAA